jgi:hypothetical protein
MLAQGKAAAAFSRPKCTHYPAETNGPAVIDMRAKSRFEADTHDNTLSECVY